MHRVQQLQRKVFTLRLAGLLQLIRSVIAKWERDLWLPCLTTSGIGREAERRRRGGSFDRVAFLDRGVHPSLVRIVCPSHRVAYNHHQSTTTLPTTFYP